MSLTQQRLKELLVYDPDSGVFRNRIKRRGRGKRGAEVGSRHHGYIRIVLDYQKHYAHRLAVLYMTGKPPKLEVDHINGDPSDNRWANLREATRSQNSMNSATKPSRSGVTGVSSRADRPGWRASIRVNYQKIYLGTFPTREEAIKARSVAEEKYFKEYSPTNSRGDIKDVG